MININKPHLRTHASSNWGRRRRRRTARRKKRWKKQKKSGGERRKKREATSMDRLFCDSILACALSLITIGVDGTSKYHKKNVFFFSPLHAQMKKPSVRRGKEKRSSLWNVRHRRSLFSSIHQTGRYAPSLVVVVYLDETKEKWVWLRRSRMQMMNNSGAHETEGKETVNKFLTFAAEHSRSTLKLDKDGYEWMN